jgi:glycosyltransferase involved in cell wall biosynthesis
VRAAALVPGCELRIVGDGPLRAELAAEAQRVGANLQLLGPRDDVRPELERAALLAMPCVIAADGDRDSMPVVVKEALAMEVPVVCSDEVGLPELVRPEFGRLVAPGDHEALAAALRELLDLTPQQRAAMGAAGRAHVAEHANVLTEARRLSELLR